MSHPLTDIPASFTSGERWYVFYSFPNLEKKAADAIFQETGCPTYVPVEKRIRRRPGVKAREYETAVFSRYGFVRFDINKSEWGGISDCKFVVGLIRQNSVPLAVPERVIDSIIVADRAGLFDRTKPPAIGKEVEIIDGSMAGLIGKVLRARAKEKLDVLLNFLGSEITATVSIANLRMIDAESQIMSTYCR